jgi:DNA-binding transcriptional ArsR family regulator
MSESPERATLEQQLVAELADIERKIGELEQERSAVQRMLLRARQENLLNRDVTRKNSFNRILVENKILETLEKSNKFVRTSELYSEAQRVVYSLKDQTFRSYLHRLKERGLIEASLNRGFWKRTKRPIT